MITVKHAVCDGAARSVLDVTGAVANERSTVAAFQAGVTDVLATKLPIVS